MPRKINDRVPYDRGRQRAKHRARKRLADLHPTQYEQLLREEYGREQIARHGIIPPPPADDKDDE